MMSRHNSKYKLYANCRNLNEHEIKIDQISLKKWQILIYLLKNIPGLKVEFVSSNPEKLV